MKKKQKYISTNKIILKLILIGLSSLIVCIALGIAFVQLLCWEIDGLLRFFQQQGIFFGMENYVSDFLGGAIGLTIGLFLDKICIEKINNVFQCRSFMRIIKHEMTNIKNIIEENQKSLKQKDEFIFSVKEFIINEVVSSTETISIILNIPYSKEALNNLVDNIGEIHKNIYKYNSLLEKISTEVSLLKIQDNMNNEKKEINNLKDDYNNLLSELNNNSIEILNKIEYLLQYIK